MQQQFGNLRDSNCAVGCIALSNTNNKMTEQNHETHLPVAVRIARNLAEREILQAESDVYGIAEKLNTQNERNEDEDDDLRDLQVTLCLSKRNYTKKSKVLQELTITITKCQQEEDDAFERLGKETMDQKSHDELKQIQQSLEARLVMYRQSKAELRKDITDLSSTISTTRSRILLMEEKEQDEKRGRKEMQEKHKSLTDRWKALEAAWNDRWQSTMNNETSIISAQQAARIQTLEAEIAVYQLHYGKYKLDSIVQEDHKLRCEVYMIVGSHWSSERGQAFLNWLKDQAAILKSSELAIFGQICKTYSVDSVLHTLNALIKLECAAYREIWGRNSYRLRDAIKKLPGQYNQVSRRSTIALQEHDLEPFDELNICYNTFGLFVENKVNHAIEIKGMGKQPRKRGASDVEINERNQRRKAFEGNELSIVAN